MPLRMIPLDERAPIDRIPRDSDIQQLPKLKVCDDDPDTWTVTLQAIFCTDRPSKYGTTDESKQARSPTNEPGPTRSIRMIIIRTGESIVIFVCLSAQNWRLLARRLAARACLIIATAVLASFTNARTHTWLHVPVSCV